MKLSGVWRVTTYLLNNFRAQWKRVGKTNKLTRHCLFITIVILLRVGNYWTFQASWVTIATNTNINSIITNINGNNNNNNSRIIGTVIIFYFYNLISLTVVENMFTLISTWQCSAMLIRCVTCYANTFAAS
jgi:hypothetical protein